MGASPDPLAGGVAVGGAGVDQPWAAAFGAGEAASAGVEPLHFCQGRAGLQAALGVEPQAQTAVI